MITVVGVVFGEKGRTYYFSPNNNDLKLNESVIVETEKGLYLGFVSKEKFQIKESEIKGELKNIIKKADKNDLKKYENNNFEAKKAMKKCQSISDSMQLNMKIIDANYTFDKDKLIFKFLSDSRVDFRNLAKKLASIYHTRIELLQVGVRDKAKEIGGYGQCGRQLCCHKFLNDIESVSISMAKNQNISLNPSKINGVCGRLLCCLKYEDECYKNCRSQLPKVGDKIDTEEGYGTVVGLNILKQKIRVNIPEKGIIEIDIEDVSN